MAFEGRDLIAPGGLATPGFRLRPLLAADAVLDHAAVMESRELLRRWEQSTWPEDDFTIDANREDLERHEGLHAEGRAFTYTMMDPADMECLGCVYLFPTDASFIARATVEAIGDSRWEDFDAAVYFWVRASRLRDGLHSELLAVLRTWLEEDWDLGPHLFVTNEQFVQQVELIGETDLELRFRFAEPDKAGRFLAYGEPGS